MPLSEREIRGLLKNLDDHKILNEKHLALLQLGETYAKQIEEAKANTTRLIDERDLLIVQCVSEDISYSDICEKFGISRQRAQQVARSIDLVTRALSPDVIKSGIELAELAAAQKEDAAREQEQATSQEQIKPVPVAEFERLSIKQFEA